MSAKQTEGNKMRRRPLILHLKVARRVPLLSCKKVTKELYLFDVCLSLCSLTLEFRNYKYVLKLADINTRLNNRIA